MAEITREAALGLLRKYNKEEFHLLHALTVEAVMRWYANDLGFAAEADHWALVGLLHDVDFEQFPDQHCKKSAGASARNRRGRELHQLRMQPRLRPLLGHKAGASDGKGALRLGRTDRPHLGRRADAPVEERLRHGAQEPQEKIQGQEIRRRLLARCHSAGRGEMLGWPLDELLEKTLEAMRAAEPQVAAEMESMK